MKLQCKSEKENLFKKIAKLKEKKRLLKGNIVELN